MMEPLAQRLLAIPDKAVARALQLLLEPYVERMRSCALSTAGLVIKAGSSALAKTGSAITHYIANGVKGRIAGSTDMPALVGTVTNAKFNVFVFTVDSGGTVRVQIGVEGATEAAIKWPVLDQKRAILGMIIINPTGTGNFVGGTTALDDVTVVPNAQYISPVGVFDPTTKI